MKLIFFFIDWLICSCQSLKKWNGQCLIDGTELHKTENVGLTKLFHVHKNESIHKPEIWKVENGYYLLFPKVEIGYISYSVLWTVCSYVIRACSHHGSYIFRSYVIGPNLQGLNCWAKLISSVNKPVLVHHLLSMSGHQQQRWLNRLRHQHSNEQQSKQSSKKKLEEL